MPLLTDKRQEERQGQDKDCVFAHMGTQLWRTTARNSRRNKKNLFIGFLALFKEMFEYFIYLIE